MLVAVHLGEPRPAHLARLLEVLVEINVDFLHKHPATPALYRSGVYFRREPPRQERWSDIPEVLRRGFGDCEDLAAWLCAELRVKGVRARPAIRTGGRSSLLHAVVLLPSGRELDPSKRLGMKGRG